MSNTTVSEATDVKTDPRPEIAGLVARARAAHDAIAHYTQEQVDALVLAVG